MKVSYDGGDTWTSLGNIQGEPGSDGKTPELKLEDNKLYVRYGEDDEWELLGELQASGDGSETPGQDGKTPQLKLENGNLYVRYSDTEEWTLLGNVQGADGSDGTNGTNGTNGAPGQDGEDGADGITPQLRINAETNEWEVSYDNGTTWTSLGVKATGKKGDKGDTGAAGADGKDGIDGKDGADGKDGEKGADGLSVAATVIGSTALASEIALVAYALIKKKKLF